MGRIIYSDTFTRHYQMRANKNVRQLYRQRLALFLKDPYNASLRNHPLDHQWAGYRSFSLTDESGSDDFRIIFKVTKGGYIFTEFGTHDQLYRPWR